MHTVVEPDERRVRRLGLACALVFLLGVVGVATVQPSSGDESRLVAAVAATARTGSARIAVEGSVAVGESRFTTKGEGMADFERERASVTMDSPGGGGSMRVVTDGSTFYMQGPLYQAVAQGKQWVAVDAKQFGGHAFGGAGASGADVLSSLRSLEEDGVLRSVSEVGVDEVRGVRTVHYRGEFEPDALARRMTGGNERMREAMQTVQMRSGSVDVWVGDDGLVRRMTTTTSMSMPGTKADTSTTIDLFDFGVPVQIDVPPPDQVHHLAPPG